MIPLRSRSARTRTRRAARALALAALVLAMGAPVLAAVTPAHLAVLFLRVLTFDRALKSRAGNELAVAIVYRTGDGGSETARAGLAAKLDPPSWMRSGSGDRPQDFRSGW
jgi:hypothetical protein